MTLTPEPPIASDTVEWWRSIAQALEIEIHDLRAQLQQEQEASSLWSILVGIANEKDHHFPDESEFDFLQRLIRQGAEFNRISGFAMKSNHMLEQLRAQLAQEQEAHRKLSTYREVLIEAGRALKASHVFAIKYPEILGVDGVRLRQEDTLARIRALKLEK